MCQIFLFENCLLWYSVKDPVKNRQNRSTNINHSEYLTDLNWTEENLDPQSSYQKYDPPISGLFDNHGQLPKLIRHIRSDSDKQLSDHTESYSDDTAKEIQTILDHLQKGEENVEYAADQEAILVLGNTGSGKSTLTLLMTGDNTNLESMETRPGSNEFLIRDREKDRISFNSTITSHTEVPELVRDTTETNAAFYDCPGFSDTRSAAHEISITYFIKKS